jgi:hypothetical protein
LEGWTKEGWTQEAPSKTDLTKEGWTAMSQSILRFIFRWIHIIFSIPILGYIYGPIDEVQKYAPVLRRVFVPIMIVSGLWMWKGHLLRRLIPRRSFRQNATV